MGLTFAIYRRDRPVRSTTVTESIIRIGSDPRNALFIDDDAALLMHAVIEVVADEATLIDLGSEVGTWVNGNRVNRCKLRSGDEVRIGTTLFRVE